MSNALTKFGNFDSMLESAKESQASVEQELNDEDRGGVSYMDFKPAGQEQELSPWEFGPKDERQAVHPDSEWIVDVTTFQHGWMGFKKGKGGKLISGQQPDKILTPWYKEFPARPTDPEMAHVDGRTWQFRCICRSSPIEEHLGVLVEVCDNRRMKEGYDELERELRARLVQASKVREAEGEEAFQRFWLNSCPVIRFKFKLGVQTNYGPKNKGIIQLIDWDMPVVVEDDVQGEETEEAPKELAEAVEKKQAEEAPTARRRRRT